MAGKLGFTFLDRSGENSRVDIPVADVTAANINAILATADQDTVGGLGESIAALSLCTLTYHDLNVGKVADNTGQPASPWAQRESGLMVTYQDSVTNRLYRITIPGGDRATLEIAGSDNVDTTDAGWIAFVTAFEAIAVSQDDNPVTVVGGRFVGRAS